MPLPQDLVQAIDVAFEAMLQNPLHDLNLGYRHSIWAALGPPLNQPLEITNSGLRKRTCLAILSIRRVLPIWEGSWPKDDTPHRILVEAEHILNGKAEVQIAQRDVGVFWTYMDNLACNSIDTNSIMVGYGAVKALSTALFDERFDPSNIRYNLTDADIDPYDSDAAFAAAVAYANGPIWDPRSNPEKRRTFWEWWLGEAVRTAWCTVD